MDKITFRQARRTARSVVLLLGLVAATLAPAAAITNFQAASLVLGQPGFTSSDQATTASGMYYPRGIAVDPTTGKVFVADSFNNRVLRFASVGGLSNGAAAEAVLGQPDFTSAGPARTQTGMNRPSAVAVDTAGRLWIADFANGRVLRFDSAAAKASGAPADGVLGKPDFTSGVGSLNPTADLMAEPFGVAVDSAGRLWVADLGDNRVLRFDYAASKANGAPADGVLGQSGFVTGSSGTSRTTLNQPTAVAVDNSGRLWIVDGSNNRVLRFDYAANRTNGVPADGVLGQPNFNTAGAATTQSGVDSPGMAAVDDFGQLWLTDTNNARVLRFDNAARLRNGAPADLVLGQPDFTSRNRGTGANEMVAPYGVTVDNLSSLWVSDVLNNRVVRFDVSFSEIGVGRRASLFLPLALR